MKTASCLTIGELREVLDELIQELGADCEWYGYEDETLMITKWIHGYTCDVAVVTPSDIDAGHR